MQKFVTNLWYDTEAEEAAAFYCSLFDDSKIINVQYYPETGGRPTDLALVVDFELGGQKFTAINGGGDYHYTHAMSVLVNCDGQEEVDRLWSALTADGGTESQCGWLNDKYGVPWQIWPTQADELLSGDDRDAVNRATTAMFGMQKIDLQALRDAREGKGELSIS